MGNIRILEETTKYPLQLMGKAAGFAYNSDTTDPEKNRKRGLQCVLDGHGRMLEYPSVYFEADGYSCRMARELFRHVGDGLTAVQRSTRYVNERCFDYYTPQKIEENALLEPEYDRIMDMIAEGYDMLLKLGAAKEDAANVLPLGMNTQFSMKRNARLLHDMSGVRMCNRALKEYRVFMDDLKKALDEVSDEWKELNKIIFQPKCERLGFCDESMSCGKFPRKQLTL